MESLKHVIEDSIRTLQLLQEAYSSNEGWIVESENYINVGSGNGLNGTAFSVKCPQTSTKVKVWDTRELAEKHGADYYLVDGNNRPVQMVITNAYDFFSREIEKYKKLLELQENRKKEE